MAILIAGPTASGKSALALDVAQEVNGLIINTDSMQVYRDLPILTARPGAASLARAPHRLYGVLGAQEKCSAGRWLELAGAALEEARETGKTPIFVGGTGLYFRALEEGLAPVPPVPEDCQTRAAALYDEIGGPAFRAALAARDPESAARLPGADRQRLIRAWGVVEATGTPLSAWQKIKVKPLFTGPRLGFVLAPERVWLYQRCDARFDAMMAAGALDEVRALRARGLAPALPALRALGVRPLLRALDGELPLTQAVTEAKTLTRRYAKRQMTWFRTQMIAWRHIKMEELERIRDEIFTNIRTYFLTGR